MAWIALTEPFAKATTTNDVAGAFVLRMVAVDAAHADSDAIALLRTRGRTLLYAASPLRDRSLPQSSDVALTASAPQLVHVAIVYDSVGTLSPTVAIYCNGELYKPVYDVPLLAVFASGAAALSIGGGDRDGATFALPFDVEQVRVYDTALSPDDIRIVYAAEQCSNGRMDSGERGVDCGGVGCASCSDRCANGVVDGDETDVDCGGMHCAVCNDGAPQVAVLERYAPRDRRRMLAGMILGGNGGRSSQLTLSLLHGRTLMRTAKIVAMSGVSNADAGGRCMVEESIVALMGNRGLLPNKLYHSADWADSCEHSWRDSRATAAVVVDFGRDVRIDEMRVMNWNVVNSTDAGVRLLDIAVAGGTAGNDHFKLLRTSVALAEAPGVASAAFEQQIVFTNTTGRFLKLYKMVDWRNRDGGALSKLRFVGQPLANETTGQAVYVDSFLRDNGLAVSDDDAGGVGVSDGASLRPFMQGDVVRLRFTRVSTLLVVEMTNVVRFGGATRGPFARLQCDNEGGVPVELSVAESHLFGVRGVRECTLSAVSNATFLLGRLSWREQQTN